MHRCSCAVLEPCCLRLSYVVDCSSMSLLDMCWTVHNLHSSTQTQNIPTSYLPIHFNFPPILSISPSFPVAVQAPFFPSHKTIIYLTLSLQTNQPVSLSLRDHWLYLYFHSYISFLSQTYSIHCFIGTSQLQYKAQDLVLLLYVCVSFTVKVLTTLTLIPHTRTLPSKSSIFF